MIDLKIILITAILIEVINIFVRFTFKISSKEIMIKIMKKFRLRKFFHFHHMFIGLIISVIFFYNNLLFNLGLAVMLSDLVHHFITLWIIIGNPEFHLIYKNLEFYEKEIKKEDRKIKKIIKHLIHPA